MFVQVNLLYHTAFFCAMGILSIASEIGGVLFTCVATCFAVNQENIWLYLKKTCKANV